MERSGVAVILAAGRGTRMKSRLGKVLHPLLGKPMVQFPVNAARGAGLSSCVVVNHQEDAVRAALAGQDDVHFARQETPRGTGDAVQSALSVLPASGVAVVMNGDGPLLTAQTLTRLLDAHGDNLVTLLTVHVDEPGRYGRVVRDAQGAPLRIVEADEATPEQLALTEINTGIYALDIAWLRVVLPTFQPHPPKGEIYLTDTLELAAKAGRATAIVVDDPAEVEGINDRWQLAAARRILQQRRIAALARTGVTFENPETTVVEADVEIGQDAWISTGVVLRGRTLIGEGARIGAHTVIEDSIIGAGVEVKPLCVLTEAVIDDGALYVGPFARLRPKSRVMEGARVGNFVEVKKATLERGAKVNHLSYIGDATVGAGANVGAGTITCNYDGFQKNRTEIGAGAFIGSNTALVAPVTVGPNAIVAAGSTVTADVPADALALGRARQTNLADRAPQVRAKLQGDKADG
ncbi:MAG: bifunctional UDP-N-acetylglucosamine diphosphorylase/glucosamine-1-phosphate N-acetyltransferase GlmU [Myxococcota bacterium]